jgi:flagellar biosynthesis anti-sigma factor FlgM
MRVDLNTFGAEPPEPSKPGRAAETDAQADAAKTDGAKTGVSGAPADASGDVSSSPSSNASAVDQARFSFDQARVQSLATEVLAQPEIRQEKVDTLQQAIGNGEYSVAPSQVADAIVSNLVGAA